MKRQDTAFGAAVFGAVLVSAGALGHTSGGLVATVGVVAALAGLMSLRTRGSLALILAGGWLLFSGIMGVALTTWNTFVSGLAVVSLGFVVGAIGSTAEEVAQVPGEE